MGGAALASAVLALCVCSAPAHAASPIIGLGDQKPAMFTDPRPAWLGIHHVRLVVPWYVEVNGTDGERAQVREWLAAARAHGATPLVGFGHGYRRSWRRRIPPVPDFRAAFLAFRRAYPWVRAYVPWNEANNCTRPTCVTPRRHAEYFDTIADRCLGCRVAAGAFVTSSNMRRWVRSFARAARHRPAVWALHNYSDVNRLRWSRTRDFLRLVRGRVWLTESGGIVRHLRRDRARRAFPSSPPRAARVTRFLLGQARRDRRRIRRVYLYHWNIDPPRPAWDSALVGAGGRPRPAFAVVARHLGRDPRRAPPILVGPPWPTPPTSGTSASSPTSTTGSRRWPIASSS